MDEKTISLIASGGTIEYGVEKPETRIFATFNVTGSAQTRIARYYSQYGTNVKPSDTFSSVELDGQVITGEELDVAYGQYSLSIGQHDVIYTLKDITKLGKMAFDMCPFYSITLPQSITTIGNECFHSCSEITSISFPNKVTDLSAGICSSCNNLTAVTLPSELHSIGYNCFKECMKLASIEIPVGTVLIQTGSFRNCRAMTSLTIPNTVETIGQEAFYDCSKLTTITIPASVTNIGANAFTYCEKLDSLTVLATTPPTLGSSAFNNTKNCPIYVPAESVNAYKAAENWSTYSSRIRAIQ